MHVLKKYMYVHTSICFVLFQYAFEVVINEERSSLHQSLDFPLNDDRRMVVADNSVMRPAIDIKPAVTFKTSPISTIVRANHQNVKFNIIQNLSACMYEFPSAQIQSLFTRTQNTQF